MAILNRYKDILEDLVDSSDIKPLNMPRLVDKRSCNVMTDFEDPQTEPKLDKNISDKLPRQQWHCKISIAGDFIGQQCHATQDPGPKNDKKV